MLGGNNRLAASAWCRRYLVEQHPGGPESVAQHGKPVGEEGLLHLHEDLPALREKGIDALGFLLAVNCERQICAPHRLTLRNVGAHHHGVPELQAGMQDGVLLLSWHFAGVGALAVCHHQRDLPAEIRPEEREGLLPLPAEVEEDARLIGPPPVVDVIIYPPPSPPPPPRRQLFGTWLRFAVPDAA